MRGLKCEMSSSPSRPTPSAVNERGERPLRYSGWLIGVSVAAIGVVRDLRLIPVGDVLGATSILTGFLFGTLVFVFQLRLRITDDPHVPNFGRLRRFIDLSFGHLSEATVTAIALTAVAVLADVTAHLPTDGSPPSVNRWYTASIALLGVRLLALMPLVVWDLRKAYREVPG